VKEVQDYLAEPKPEQKIIAIPGAGLEIPIWILGSSVYSAHLAAALGLPYAFAGHFAPNEMLLALEIYRREFRPSARWRRAHAMVCVQALAADSDERASFLATTLYQRFLGIIRHQRTLSRAPVETMDGLWSAEERAAVLHTFRYALIGGPERIRKSFTDLIELTQADEVMLCSELFSLEDKLRSLRIFAELRAATLPPN
jgi:luciferase family oxidoreductase group 1